MILPFLSMFSSTVAFFYGVFMLCVLPVQSAVISTSMQHWTSHSNNRPTGRLPARRERLHGKLRLLFSNRLLVSKDVEAHDVNVNTRRVEIVLHASPEPIRIADSFLNKKLLPSPVALPDEIFEVYRTPEPVSVRDDIFIAGYKGGSS